MSLQALIDQLLYEEEGDTLDFKSEQYRFSGASDDEKSELLKDILAFANAWRRADAYILIGTKEVKGGRSEVIGLAEHLDDAHLQQFVNSKTQRPITFSYKALEYEGRQIGVIHIPVQRRPYYLSKDFGRLKRDQVYIRRSSSTDIASIDEISLIGNVNVGSQNYVATLEGYLVFGHHDETIEKRVNCKLVNATLPEDDQFPDYSQQLTGVFARYNLDTSNRNYYREKAKYHQEILRIRGFKIGIRNSGSIPARDVKVIFEIASNNGVFVLSSDKIPKKPKSDSLSSAFMRSASHGIPDIDIKKVPAGWRITCQLGKIQPKDTVITKDYFCVGSCTSNLVQIRGQIFSDDLPEPKKEILEIEMEVEDRVFTVNDFIQNKTA